MQALVKTPRTNIRIQGDIPSHVLDMLKSEYGGELKRLSRNKIVVYIYT
jgi:hypothetical protein